MTSVCVPEKNANRALPEASKVGPSMLAQPVTIGVGDRTAPVAVTGVCIRSYRPLEARRCQATCNVPSPPRAVPTRSEIFSCPLVCSDRHGVGCLSAPDPREQRHHHRARNDSQRGPRSRTVPCRHLTRSARQSPQRSPTIPIFTPADLDIARCPRLIWRRPAVGRI